MSAIAKGLDLKVWIRESNLPSLEKGEVLVDLVSFENSKIFVPVYIHYAPSQKEDLKHDLPQEIDSLQQVKSIEIHINSNFLCGLEERKYFSYSFLKPGRLEIEIVPN